MSGESLTANIARVVRLAYTVDAYEAGEGSLHGVADSLRSLGAAIRRDVDAELARHRAEVESQREAIELMERDWCPRSVAVPLSEHRAEVDVLAREVNTLKSEIGGLELGILQEQMAAASLESENERLREGDEQQERDRAKALRIAGERLAEAVKLRAEVERLTRERDAAASAHRERVEEVEMLTGGEGELWAWCPSCSKPCGPFRERRDGALCACESVVVFAVNWRERAETAERERDALAEALDWAAPLPWSVVTLDYGDVEVADADGDDLFVIETCAFEGSPADYANGLVRRLAGLERLTAPESSPTTGATGDDQRGGEMLLSVAFDFDGLMDDLDRYAFGETGKRVRPKPGAREALGRWADVWLDVSDDGATTGGEQP